MTETEKFDAQMNRHVPGDLGPNVGMSVSAQRAEIANIVDDLRREFEDDFLAGGTMALEPEEFTDYPRDLNAMRGALNHLSDEQMLDYMRYLTGDEVPSWMTVRRMALATPAECAEAFLKTFKRWEGA